MKTFDNAIEFPRTAARGNRHELGVGGNDIGLRRDLVEYERQKEHQRMREKREAGSREGQENTGVKYGMPSPEPICEPSERDVEKHADEFGQSEYDAEESDVREFMLRKERQRQGKNPVDNAEEEPEERKTVEPLVDRVMMDRAHASENR